MNDFFGEVAGYTILFWIVGSCLVLVLLYWVIRLAISRGLRDHQLWLEKRQRAAAPPPMRTSLVPPSND